jgi:hypothetical protein
MERSAWVSDENHLVPDVSALEISLPILAGPQREIHCNGKDIVHAPGTHGLRNGKERI